jgi:hypothetical protein
MDKLKDLINGLILTGMLLSAQAPAAAITAPQKPVLQSLNEPQTPAIHRSLSIKGYKTLSGTKILFIRTPGLPMFDVLVSFAAGSAHTPHQPGLAAVTFSLLNEGVTGKDVNAIQATFDDLGARMGMDIDQDRTHFSLRSLSDESRRTPALELFAQVLGMPLRPDKRTTASCFPTMVMLSPSTEPGLGLPPSPAPKRKTFIAKPMPRAMPRSQWSVTSPRKMPSASVHRYPQPYPRDQPLLRSSQ